MSTTKDEQRAKAQAWLDNIKEAVWALHKASEADDSQAIEEAQQTIQQGPLCVEVRSGWYVPGNAHEGQSPAEYAITLTTGGPALRLIGSLDSGCPEDARLEYQDWGMPWTRLPMSGDDETACLTYAQQFYFES